MNTSRYLQLDNFEKTPHVPGTPMPTAAQRANTALQEQYAALKEQIEAEYRRANYESSLELPDELTFLQQELERARARATGGVSEQRNRQPAPRPPSNPSIHEMENFKFDGGTDVPDPAPANAGRRSSTATLESLGVHAVDPNAPRQQRKPTRTPAQELARQAPANARTLVREQRTGKPASQMTKEEISAHLAAYYASGGW